jgi:hypothetical protein
MESRGRDHLRLPCSNTVDGLTVTFPPFIANHPFENGHSEIFMYAIPNLATPHFKLHSAAAAAGSSCLMIEFTSK